jgi:hypothetical protein
MIRWSERTRRGLGEAIGLPGSLAGAVSLLLLVLNWLGGA